MSKRKSAFVKIFIVFLLVAISAIAYFGYKGYDDIYKPNVTIKDDKDHAFVFVPSDADYDSLLVLIKEQVEFDNEESFHFVAGLKNLEAKVKGGKYRVKKGMSNNELVNMFRAGLAEEVKVVVKFHRKTDKLAKKVATYIEAEEHEIDSLLNDEEYLKQFGMKREEVIAMFIPNTYFFKWNTSADQFIQRMHSYYQKFWTEERKWKADALKLTPLEVSTVASIVHLESKFDDEKPRVAGVYLNRIEKKMKLQADPTVVYAVNNFKLRRVLKKHLRYDSPYNTYKYAGLPPGPICTPSIASIDAVLNREEHDYIFFCAKEDFSGYHNFAKTLKQHNANARKFQRALNKRKIYK